MYDFEPGVYIKLQTSKIKLRIVAESDRWIVVDKPANLQAHPSRPDGSRTLWHELSELLAFEIANGGQISIINRLDRETSGLTLICKHAAAARHFSQLMMQRRIQKEYLALVWGWPERDRYKVEVPILRQGSKMPSRIYLKQCVHAEGSTAQTTFVIEKRFARETSNGGHFSLIRAIPHTGRMHQIRVHLAHLGHPVVGDKIYGPNEENYLRFIQTGWTLELAQSLLLPRHALHSAELRVDDEKLAWHSLLPEDLAEFASAPDSDSNILL
jgi:23S rRNA pseudouridine1911/1915/1917 synthase